MFDGLEDALNSFVCHPRVKEVYLSFRMPREVWECRIVYTEDRPDLTKEHELTREGGDPLDAYIEARDAFREAISSQEKVEEGVDG